MKMKKLLSFMLTLAVVLTMFSIYVYPDTKKVLIGVSMKTMSDPYSRKLGEAIQNRAKTYKDVQLILTDAQADVNTQISQVENMVAQKVDVLVLNAQDVEGSGKAVDLCNQKNIPVIEVNTQTTNNKYLSYVGSSDLDAGMIMGNHVKSLLKGKGNVVVLEGNMGQSPQIYRYEGLKKTLLNQPGIKVLAVQTANWQRDQAMAKTEDWLQKFKQIDAILCENDDMAMGALEAVKTSGRKNIIIMGVDAIPDALNAVKDGRLTGTVFQDAKGQGDKAVDVARDAAMGKKVEKNYIIPFQLVTKGNAAKFIGKK